jgi:cytochrome b6-f complex iron-sulfur subunit
MMDGELVKGPARDEVTYAWVSRTREVMVFRHEGKLRACSAICPHMGARLELDHGQGIIVCPWHGLSFALDGLCSNHHRYAQLKGYEVREEGGEVRLG